MTDNSVNETFILQNQAVCSFRCINVSLSSLYATNTFINDQNSNEIKNNLNLRSKDQSGNWDSSNSNFQQDEMINISGFFSYSNWNFWYSFKYFSHLLPPTSQNQTG